MKKIWGKCKNLKGTLTLVALILITVTTFVLVFREPKSYAELKLTDISGHWAQEDILFMQQKGAVNGYPDGTFLPQNNITYGEAIKLIVAYYDNQITNGSKHWADNYLSYAEKNGIVNKGMYANRLDEKASRKEIINMIYNSLKNLAYKPIIENDEYALKFPDVNDSINTDGIDYCTAIKACYLLGIVIGNDEGNMQPDAEITRAEITTIIARAYNEARRKYSVEEKESDLPKDASLYKMIYAYMPNSFYNAGLNDWAKYDQEMTPSEYLNPISIEMGTTAQSAVRSKLETGVGALINFSYKMTDAQWKQWKKEIINLDDIKLTNDDTPEEIDKYIQYVKDNKLEMRGGIVLNPSTLGYMYTNFQPGKTALAIKGYIDYKVTSNPNNVDKITMFEYYVDTTQTSAVKNPEYIVIYLWGNGFANELYKTQTRCSWMNIIGED